MKKIYMTTLVLGIVAVFTLPAVALKPPQSVTLDIAGQGVVDFDHGGHLKYAKGCKECHHMGVGNGACDGCHGVTSQAPALGDAYASLCLRCHADDATATAAPAERKWGKKKNKKHKRD